ETPLVLNLVALLLPVDQDYGLIIGAQRALLRSATDILPKLGMTNGEAPPRDSRLLGEAFRFGEASAWPGESSLVSSRRMSPMFSGDARSSRPTSRGPPPRAVARSGLGDRRRSGLEAAEGASTALLTAVGAL